LLHLFHYFGWALAQGGHVGLRQVDEELHLALHQTLHKSCKSFGFYSLRQVALGLRGNFFRFVSCIFGGRTLKGLIKKLWLFLSQSVTISGNAANRMESCVFRCVKRRRD
jgi:hypothetical protein